MKIESNGKCPCCLGPSGGYVSACMRCFEAHQDEFKDARSAVGRTASDTDAAIAWYRAKGEQLRAAAAKSSREIPYEDQGPLTVKPNRRAVYLAGVKLRAEGKMPALNGKAEPANYGHCSSCDGTITTLEGLRTFDGKTYCSRLRCAPGVAKETERAAHHMMIGEAGADGSWNVRPARAIRDAAHLGRLLFSTDAALLAALARVEGHGAPVRAELVERAWQRDEGGRKTWAEATAAAVMEYEEIRK